MKSESLFQKRVMRDLKSLSSSWVLKTQERTRKGVPDVLVCINGFFVAIELKASEKAKVAPLQAFEVSCINNAGGRAYIAFPENWNEIFNELKKI